MPDLTVSTPIDAFMAASTAAAAREAIGAASAGTHPQTMIEGLLGHWPLEANGSDSLGYNNLTPVGAVSYVTNPALGNPDICFLDGASWLSSDGVAFDLKKSFTVVAWVSTITGESPAYNPVVSQWMFGSDGFILCPSGGSGVRFQPTNLADNFSGYLALEGEYQFIVGTYDGNIATLWRNEIPISSNVVGPMYWIGNGSFFQIGTVDNGGEFTYHGFVHHVGLWNRVLTREQILALYNGGTPLPFSSFETTLA